MNPKLEAPIHSGGSLILCPLMNKSTLELANQAVATINLKGRKILQMSTVKCNNLKKLSAVQKETEDVITASPAEDLPRIVVEPVFNGGYSL